MKNHIYLMLLVILFSCQTGKKNQYGYTPSSPALRHLETHIQSWVDNGYYDGVAIKIIKEDKTLFEYYCGNYADTTVLHVASAGKWIAAATIASVVDEGKLSWDDPVCKYLPEFKDIKGKATLRQLLSHTAGYPDYQPEGKRKDDYQTLTEAVSNIAALPADTLPGMKFKYGGLAMQVAGRMAEVVTGKDWESIFQEKIAKPLKMEFSHFVPVSEEPGFSPMLGGGFRTCLRDYINFLNMFAHDGMFNGQQILSINAISEIVADQVKNASIPASEYVATARNNLHNGIYGLGIWREELSEDGIATMISSPGWAGAYPWIDRTNHVYGFCLAKVNGKAFVDDFSSFYESAALPLLVRDAINTYANK